MPHRRNRNTLALLAVAVLAAGAIAACGGASAGETPTTTELRGLSVPEEDQATAGLPTDDASIEDSLASSVEVEADFGRFCQLISRDTILPI